MPADVGCFGAELGELIELLVEERGLELERITDADIDDLFDDGGS